MSSWLNTAIGQDSRTGYNKVSSFPDKLLSAIQKNSERLDRRLTEQTEKYLDKVAKQERKLQRKLMKVDSAKAIAVFGDTRTRYQHLKQQLRDSALNIATGSDHYNGHLDSMQTALKFFKENKNTQQLPDKANTLANVSKSYDGLGNKFNKTASIRKQLDERKAYLKKQLVNTPLAGSFRKYQQEVYYYKAQLEEYKNAIDHPEKLERKLLQVATKIPAFKSFFAKYSQLASLYPAPFNSGTIYSLAGLQTRASVQSVLQTQMISTGTNPQAMLQQGIGEAKRLMSELRDRVTRLGAGGSDLDMPDFKPNAQRTKSFLQRIEYSTNVQTQRSGAFYPTTTDFGLMAGYKPNDKSVIGIGAAYKMGWGKGLQHIALSSEGIAFRSFADFKLKGSFFASGGFEYNYQQPFNTFSQIESLNAWQRSGLVGISKIVSMKTKLFKKTKLQVLWDFLSYQQIPVGQPIKFRVGYTF